MTYNLFELIMPKIEFDKNKPIKLFEAFAGIGTQAMALKKLGVEIDHIGISEIDKYALMSYKAIHGKVKNYGDISKIKGGGIRRDRYIHLFVPLPRFIKSRKTSR
jgi:site-specific DNA-cytosine methylase